MRRQKFLELSNTSLIMRRKSKGSVLVDPLLVLPIPASSIERRRADVHSVVS